MDFDDVSKPSPSGFHIFELSYWFSCHSSIVCTTVVLRVQSLTAMGPPTTRSQTKKGELQWVVATQQSKTPGEEGPPEAGDTKCQLSNPTVYPLSTVLQELEDSATVQGRDAKRLRDATVDAIGDVREESRTVSGRLAQEVRDSNNSLLSGLNASFASIDDRIRSFPMVASLLPDASVPKIPSFSGTGDNIHFASWLRRFEDVVRMRVVPLTSEQKANLLIAHLDGVAHEKIEELRTDERQAFEAIVSHLKAFFEGPHQRNMARQALAMCRQEPSETCAMFANRLLGLVRAAMAGQDHSAQKERALEEFLARLRPDVRYVVKLDNPTSFEQAVNRAQTVEQLQAEATADRLYNPFSHNSANVSALSTQQQGESPLVTSRGNSSRSTFRSRHPDSRRTAPRHPITPNGQLAQPWIECYNCGGRGHMARQCSSSTTRPRPPTSGTQLASYSGDSRIRRNGPPRDQAVRGEGGQLSNRIGSISLPQEQPQSELDRANARVAALLERNNQLSQMAFGGKHSPTARSTSPLRLNTVFLGLAIAFVCSPTVQSQPVWLCPAEDHDAFLFVSSPQPDNSAFSTQH